MAQLISFRGKIGAGKTWCSRYLVRKHGFTKISFADALKCEMFDVLWSGYDKVFDLYPDAKTLPRPDAEFPGLDLYYIGDEVKLDWIDRNKLTLRPFLQFYGTEYRRGQDDQYWLKQWVLKAKSAISVGAKVVVDDARFINEISTIRDIGGESVRLVCTDDTRLARLKSRDGIVAVGDVAHDSELLAETPMDGEYVVSSEVELELITVLDTLFGPVVT
jgi:hypothetical protein